MTALDADPWNLQRFLTAQDDGGTWHRALAEIASGRKMSHWMWFVFPQLAALGRSATARFYGLDGAEEAAAYLHHPLLGPRLVQSMQAVLAVAVDPDTLLGSVDSMKLRSCASLFKSIAPDTSEFSAIIDARYEGIPDPQTLALLH